MEIRGAYEYLRSHGHASCAPQSGFVLNRAFPVLSCYACHAVLRGFLLRVRAPPPGSIPPGTVQAADRSCERLRCGRRAGAGAASRSESGGGERRHGRVLSPVR